MRLTAHTERTAFTVLGSPSTLGVVGKVEGSLPAFLTVPSASIRLIAGAVSISTTWLSGHSRLVDCFPSSQMKLVSPSVATGLSLHRSDPRGDLLRNPLQAHLE